MIPTGENQITSKQTFPTATLSTINPMLGLCGDRTVINHLRYGTAFQRLTSELYTKTQLYYMKNTVHVNERPIS
jgi:hypothetical protein